MLEVGANERATPMTDCASSSSPSASIRGSVFRTRSLPKRLVSPVSPVRVVTRALLRLEAGTADRICASGGMLVQVRMLPPDGRNDVPSGRGEAKDKNKKKKSKEQLEKELKRKAYVAPVQPMTIELVKPKRKEKVDW
jgi:hypothetical protein